MRTRCLLPLLAFLAFAGCGSSSPPHPADDLSMPAADMAMPDLARPLDMAMPLDLAALDQAAPDDLLAPVDLLTVDAPPPAPVIGSFTVSPSVIPAGATVTVTLSWSVSSSTSLSISGIGAVSGSSTTTSVSAATTFTLTANGPGGSDTKAASVALDDGTLGVYLATAANGGSDSNDGTPGHPVASLAHAESLAAGHAKQLYLQNGSYAVSNLTLPAGVGVEALTPGGVTLTGSTGFTFAGAGHVKGVLFNGFSTAIKASTGTVTIDSTQFTGTGNLSSNIGAIEVSGSAHVVVTPGSITNYLTGASTRFADLSGTGNASLTITGGTLSGAGPNQAEGDCMISLFGGTNATLTLDGVTISGNTLNAVDVAGGTVNVIDHSLISNTAATGSGGGNDRASIFVTATGVVNLDNSTITGSPVNGIEATGGGTVNVKNGAIVELSGARGISIDDTGTTVHLDGAHLLNNTGDGIYQHQGSLTSTAGTVISGNLNGIHSDSTISLSLRGTSVTGNQQDGILCQAAPTSFDLGSPGGNTFTGNNTVGTAPTATGGFSNVALYLGTGSYNAIGNTWDVGPNTDGSGHYTTSPTTRTNSYFDVNVKVGNTGSGVAFSIVLD